jgi:hypothetical protein
VIVTAHEREYVAHGVLAEVLDRPVSGEEVLTSETVVTCWPALDHYTGGGHRSWTSAQWVEYLDDPLWQFPGAASPRGDCHAIFRLMVELQPEDR